MSTAMTSDDDEPHGYASPACSMHEIDPAYFGLIPPPEPPDIDLVPWRKSERGRLIAARLAVNAATRAAHARRIARHLDELIGDPAGLVIGAYWPFRGEPDLRKWFEKLRGLQAVTALPVVTASRAPLVFRAWRNGDRLARGVWNIPVPAAGDALQPDIVIAPLVGFDAGCYRLGYGGGFFDRTLAMLPPTTLAIGVGYDQAAMATIHPQTFDIPMRHIVTESGIRTCRAGPMSVPGSERS